MLQEPIAITYPMVNYGFEQANMAASQTDTDINIVGGLTATYVMPFDGWLCAYSIKLSAAITAGSLEFDVEVNGSTVLTIETDAASTTEFYSRLVANSYRLQAGDLLGVTYTSDASLAPTTSDANVVLLVMYEDVSV